jgi:hypothetical protein
MRNMFSFFREQKKKTIDQKNNNHNSMDIRQCVLREFLLSSMINVKFIFPRILSNVSFYFHVMIMFNCVMKHLLVFELYDKQDENYSILGIFCILSFCFLFQSLIYFIMIMKHFVLIRIIKNPILICLFLIESKLILIFRRLRVRCIRDCFLGSMCSFIVKRKK